MGRGVFPEVHVGTMDRQLHLFGGVLDYDIWWSSMDEDPTTLRSTACTGALEWDSGSL